MLDTKARTIIKCKCGRKFINVTDIPDLFESGQIRGHLKHWFKQLFCNIAFKIHSLRKGHGLAVKYETYGRKED